MSKVMEAARSNATDKPKSFLESIKPQPGDKTPCCRFVKALIKWIWNFLITQRQLIVILTIAATTAWGICVLWGWYWTGAIVFNPSYYYALPKKELLLTIAVGTLAVMTIVYALVMQHARSARLDCSIVESNMDRLDRLWLDDKRLKALKEEEGRRWRKEQMAIVEAQATNRTLPVIRTELVARFAEQNLFQFLSKFSDEEFAILRFLIRLLEKRGLCPSVASDFQQDYDIKQFRNCNGSKPIPVTSDGKTSYEILASYTLLEHSINVATFIIEEVKAKTNTYSTLMPVAIIIALAHDIGKIAKSKHPNTANNPQDDVDTVMILDKVISVTDHPFISAMIIQERFPNYPRIDEIATLIQEHHVPADKNASLYAQALRAADKKARRQEMSTWFKKHYGTDTHPDPYRIVAIDDTGNSNGRGKTARQESEARSVMQAKEDQKESSAYEQSQTRDRDRDVLAIANDALETSAIAVELYSGIETGVEPPKAPAAKKRSAKESFGKTISPDRSVASEEDKRLGTIPFDLPEYERALLSVIANLPVSINVREGVVAALDISVIPFNETLLVSFSRVLYALRKVLPETRLDQNDFAQMAHYAIEEWRKQGIVVDIGVSYFTRKYEYYYDGRLENVSLVPFAMDRLMINSYEKLELAKKHPLFNQISNLAFARR